MQLSCLAEISTAQHSTAQQMGCMMMMMMMRVYDFSMKFC
jgi:hypothetical protein